MSRAGRVMRAASWLIAAWLMCCPCLGIAEGTASPSEPSARFEYLYIEANEGGSSGGHAAVRFADRIYHFENRHGLLVLAREHSEAFIHAYAQLGNRTIHSSHVAVTSETWQRLRDRFDERHQAQAAQIDVASALREDRLLLERWRRGAAAARAGATETSVPGAGYFLPRDSTSGSVPLETTSRAVASLRARIVAEHGADFFPRRGAELAGALATIAEPERLSWSIRAPGDPYDRPSIAYPFARRHLDLVSARTALEILDAALPLREDAVIEPDESTLPLDEDELRVVEAYYADLETELVALSASQRPDWGATLLVGMARLAALSESIASERLIYLDAFANDAPKLGGELFESRPDLAPGMIVEAQSMLDAAEAGFFGSEHPGEREWSRLEQQANRSHELMRGIVHRAEVRFERGHLVPSRSAMDSTARAARMSIPELDSAIEKAREREALYASQLQVLHGYHLIHRNCVTEIFDTLGAAFEDNLPPHALANELMDSALAGDVAHRGTFDFVPFLSMSGINSRYPVVARRTIPSLRAWRIEEMTRTENALRVALRESNTLTATSYRRGIDDSFFLFFTDHHPPLRPIFGAANLAAGLSESLWGLAKLPLDGGRTFVSGLRGSLWSLPELAFISIRKGSNDWAPRRDEATVGSVR